MHIDHDILLGSIRHLLDTRYPRKDEISLLFSLCEKIIRNDPTKNCIIKGVRSSWEDIPKTKSLFYTPQGVGLPIGNLSSQVFANLYMHIFDSFVKEKLKIRHYGRYVDDMIFLHSSREYLESLIPEISHFLSENLKLTLHPKKIEFRWVSEGIDFIGGYVKPYRTYVRNRTKGNFHTTLQEIAKQCIPLTPLSPLGEGSGVRAVWDKELQIAPSQEFLKKSRSRINSYLGYMGNFDTFRLRKTMLKEWLSWGMSRFFKPDRLYRKVRIVKSGCAPPSW